MSYRIVLLLLLLVGCTPRTTLPAVTPDQSAPRPTSTPITVAPIIVSVPTVGAVAITPTPLPAPLVDTGVLDVARSWLGVPYLWGGCSKAGVDCSCFVRNILATLGINAPRVTYQQIAWTTPVSRSQMQPFDLVYFNDTCTGCGPNPTHVGMYIGNGQMIQAGGSSVSIQPVFAGYYGAHFASAGRPPGL